MGWKGRKPVRIPAQAQRGWAHRQRDMCGVQTAAHRWAETRCPHGANSYRVTSESGTRGSETSAGQKEACVSTSKGGGEGVCAVSRACSV